MVLSDFETLIFLIYFFNSHDQKLNEKLQFFFKIIIVRLILIMFIPFLVRLPGFGSPFNYPFIRTVCHPYTETSKDH